MRHGKKFNHLGRTSSHRKAMLSNMATSLIKVKRIKTTVAKAKELRKYVEPLITKAKTDSTHNRRIVFSYLQDKEAIKILFDEIGEKVAERNGGYTRIIKLNTRLGDNADVAIIELVDYNEAMLNAAAEDESTGKTRRRRRKSKSEDETADNDEKAVAAPKEAKPAAEEVAPADATVEEVADNEVTEAATETEPTETTEDSDDNETKKEA